MLTASLHEPGPDWVRILSLELLFQIVAGESHPSESEQGRTELGEQARRAVREGLWLLYAEATGSRRDSVEEILDRVELDRARFGAFFSPSNSSPASA